MILENDYLKITFTSYGASIRSIIVKELNREIVYGYLNESSYQDNKDYFGCVVGRSAGRIRNGVIYDNDTKYELTKNFQNKHTLHGGYGLHNKKFSYELGENKIIFSTISPHLDNGFFGDCEIKIIYELIDNKLSMDIFATTKTRAYLNLTNHMAFNLNQDKEKNILNHQLLINADKMIEIDNECIPYRIVEVNNNFDFRIKKEIQQDLFAKDEQLIIGKGYDHPYLLNKVNDNLASTLEVEDLKVNIYTSFPALVLYIGNYLEDEIDLTSGKSIHRGSVALEPQGIPNNQEFEQYKNNNVIAKNKPLKEYVIWEFIISGKGGINL